MVRHLRDVHGITEMMPMPGTPGGACYPQVAGDSLNVDQGLSPESANDSAYSDTAQHPVQDDTRSSNPDSSAEAVESFTPGNEFTFNSNYDSPTKPSSETEDQSPPQIDCGATSSTQSLFDAEWLPILDQFQIGWEPLDNQNWEIPVADPQDTGYQVESPAGDLVEMSRDQTSPDISVLDLDQGPFETYDLFPDTDPPLNIWQGAGTNGTDDGLDHDDVSWEYQGALGALSRTTEDVQLPEAWRFPKAGNERSTIEAINNRCISTVPMAQEKLKRVVSPEFTPTAVTMSPSVVPLVQPPCGFVKNGHLPKPGQSWVFDPRLGSYDRDKNRNGRWRCAICMVLPMIIGKLANR